MDVNSGYFLVVVFVCFPSLCNAGGGLADVFVGAVATILREPKQYLLVNIYIYIYILT